MWKPVGGIVAALVWLCAAVELGAQTSEGDAPAVLTLDSAVVQRSGTGVVKFSLKNQTNETIWLGTSAPWSVSQVLGGQTKVVYKAIALLIPSALGPGESKNWVWSQKDNQGKLVPTGVYRITVGPVYVGETSSSFSQQVALTASGTLAGSSMFPLKVGNAWTYTAPEGGEPVTEVIGSKLKNGVTWYKMSNFVGSESWARMSGGSFANLYVLSPYAPTTSAKVLFKFGRTQGYTWMVNVAPLFPNQALKVGATNVTVKTPAGTFKGCYRIDVAGGNAGDIYFGSHWFAPGVGLVKYTMKTMGTTDTMVLTRAKIKASDGTFYTIGKP